MKNVIFAHLWHFLDIFQFFSTFECNRSNWSNFKYLYIDTEYVYADVPLSVGNHYLVCSGLPGTPIKGNIKGCGIKRAIPKSLAKRLAAMDYDFNVP